MLGELVLHGDRIGEQRAVPGVVPLAVRVLDVQPDHVDRKVVLLKLGLHLEYVRLVLVVPPTLVVRKAEEGRHWRRTSQGGVLACVDDN